MLSLPFINKLAAENLRRQFPVVERLGNFHPRWPNVSWTPAQHDRFLERAGAPSRGKTFRERHSFQLRSHPFEAPASVQRPFIHTQFASRETFVSGGRDHAARGRVKKISAKESNRKANLLKSQKGAGTVRTASPGAARQKDEEDARAQLF